MELLLSIDGMQTFIGFSIDTFGLRDWVVAFLWDHTFYLVEQQFILALYLIVTGLLDHFLLAVVNGVDLWMLHELSSDGFNLFHIVLMIDISEIEFLLLDKSVNIGSNAIHVLTNKIIIRQSINLKLITLFHTH